MELWCKNPHDGLFLSARAKVSLHLGLVHSIQGQHEEDSTHSQCPEGVTLQRVWVQTVDQWGKNMSQSIRSLKNIHFQRYCDLLQSSNAAAIHRFTPHLCHPTCLTGPHHNDCQLACKHHHRLEHVCPDHGLQTTLKHNNTHFTTQKHCTVLLIPAQHRLTFMLESQITEI